MVSGAESFDASLGRFEHYVCKRALIALTQQFASDAKKGRPPATSLDAMTEAGWDTPSPDQDRENTLNEFLKLALAGKPFELAVVKARLGVGGPAQPVSVIAANHLKTREEVLRAQRDAFRAMTRFNRLIPAEFRLPSVLSGVNASTRNKRIFKERFGLGVPRLTYAEIAAKHGVSGACARRAVFRILTQLRKSQGVAKD